MTKILAMVLAGGKGKRMDILCHMRPKPALSFAGGFRVIDFSLSKCVHSGISHIAVLTDYQRSHMADYLNRWRLALASLINFDILEPRKQTYRFGTVRVGPDSQITDFVEKSLSSQSNLASMGIYVFDKKILIERLIEDAGIGKT